MVRKTKKKVSEFSKKLAYINKGVEQAVKAKLKTVHIKRKRKTKPKIIKPKISIDVSDQTPYDVFLEKDIDFSAKRVYEEKTFQKEKKIHYPTFIKNNVHVIIKNILKRKKKKEKLIEKESSKKEVSSKISEPEKIFPLKKQKEVSHKKFDLTHFIIMLTLSLIIIFGIFTLVMLNKEIFSTSKEKFILNDNDIIKYCEETCNSTELHIINSLEFNYFVCGCNNETFWFDSETKLQSDKEVIKKRIIDSEKILTVISDYDIKCNYLCNNDCKSQNQTFLNNSVYNISNIIFCDCFCNNYSSYPLLSENY